MALPNLGEDSKSSRSYAGLASFVEDVSHLCIFASLHLCIFASLHLCIFASLREASKVFRQLRELRCPKYSVSGTLE
jgi:hypothetical protein